MARNERPVRRAMARRRVSRGVAGLELARLEYALSPATDLLQNGGALRGTSYFFCSP